MGMLQVLKLEFGKFRILNILNFHPCRRGIEGLLDRDSLKALCCVLEQDNLSSVLCLGLVQHRKTGKHPSMPEKLLTGT